MYDWEKGNLPFPWAPVLIGLGFLLLGGGMFVSTLQKAELRERLAHVNQHRGEMSESILSLRDKLYAAEERCTNAELTIEMQDSNLPHKVYYFVIKGHTGTSGTYDLEQTRIREDAPDE